MQLQMEANHALRVELLHARELLGAERASAEQSKWRLEATQAAALAARGGAAAGRHRARRLGEAAPHRAAAAQDAGLWTLYIHALKPSVCSSSARPCRSAWRSHSRRRSWRLRCECVSLVVV